MKKIKINARKYLCFDCGISFNKKTNCPNCKSEDIGKRIGPLFKD